MKNFFFGEKILKVNLNASISHVPFYSNDELFGSVSCHFSLILEYNIPCAKTVLLEEVIFYPFMDTFIDELLKTFQYFFARAAGKTNS